MLRTTKNELFIGFTISVILSLFANFALMIQRYEIIMNSPANDTTYEVGKYELWFSFVWFFLFSFILYVLYRWVYRWGDRIFRYKEIKIIVLATGICLFVAGGLFKAYPTIRRTVMPQLLVSDSVQVSDTSAINFSKVSGKSVHVFTKTDTTIKMVTGETLNMAFDTIQPVPVHVSSNLAPDEVRIGVMTVISGANSYPLLIEHIFVLLTILLTMLLIHLFDKKQEMKLEYEKVKVEQLQNSYNALMGQINPHFFFNSLNGLNSLIRAGEQKKTLEYLDELSNVFRYILRSNHKTLVTLEEEMQFVRAYTYLLGVRYEKKLFFSIQIDEACLKKRLPILSLLPLIENAVKHNVISKQRPLQIKIYTKADHWLLISNPIQPKLEECVCNGIGLKNLQGRYKMLTGKDIQVSNADNSFEVSLPLLNQST